MGRGEQKREGRIGNRREDRSEEEEECKGREEGRGGRGGEGRVEEEKSIV